MGKVVYYFYANEQACFEDVEPHVGEDNPNLPIVTEITRGKAESGAQAVEEEPKTK